MSALDNKPQTSDVATPSDDETVPFVISDEVEETEVPFSILPHLVVVGAILFGLFATIIIPSGLANLRPNAVAGTPSTPATSPVASIEPTIVLEPIPLTAKAAFVWDITNQTVLYEKQGDEPLPLASITKLMTALISYELAEDESLITITPAASRQQSGGTIRWGETFAAKDLADFALITSYNSAAYMLAASAGEALGEADPVAQFVAAMNIKAKELNLQSLVFYNPTGLDESPTQAGSYGSAADISRLVEYIMLNYPEILTPTMAASTRLYNTVGEYHESDNTNEIITDIPNLIGSKTGYTDLAGGNLTIVFDAGFNHPVVVTVLGSTHSERFSDVKKLVASVQASYAP